MMHQENIFRSLLTLFVVVFLIAGNSESLLAKPININNAVDQGLIKLKTNNTALDPMKIEETKVGGWLFGFTVYDGLLRGLSSLHRTGDCFMTISENGKVIVNVRLGLNHTDFKAHWKKWFDFLGDYFIIHAVTEGVDTSVEAVANSMSDNMEIRVLKVKILKMQKLHVWKDGLPLIDWLLNIAIDLITKIFKGFIVKTIESMMPNLIENVVDGRKLL